MKHATHISPCGRWHYKVYKNPNYREYSSFSGRELLADFWDVHCNKWRRSVLMVKPRYMVKLGD